MTSNASLIGFKIQDIEVLGYSETSHEINEKAMTVWANFDFAANEASQAVRAIFKYELRTNDLPIRSLDVAVDFLIHPESMSLLKRDEKLFLPKDFAGHLAMITVGTARGILHEHTKGTEVNRFPIPTINVIENIREDIQFETIPS